MYLEKKKEQNTQTGHYCIGRQDTKNTQNRQKTTDHVVVGVVDYLLLKNK